MVTGSRIRVAGRSMDGFVMVFLLVFTISLTGKPALGEVKMTGFRIVQETAEGRWEIRAEKASYDNLGDVLLETVSAKMISDGVQEIVVSSDRGRYETTELVLHLEGNVTVTSALGSRFETPNLQWDGPRGVMTADNGISIARGNLKVQGRSVRYTLRSGIALVDGDVHTTWGERRLSR